MSLRQVHCTETLVCFDAYIKQIFRCLTVYRLSDNNVSVPYGNLNRNRPYPQALQFSHPLCNLFKQRISILMLTLRCKYSMYGSSISLLVTIIQ